MKHRIQITEVNPEVVSLPLKWGRPEFTSDDGIGSLKILYQASDSIIAIAGFFDDDLVTIGSGVMVGPSLSEPSRVRPTHLTKPDKPTAKKAKSQPGSWTPVGRKGCPNGSTARTVEQIRNRKSQ